MCSPPARPVVQPAGTYLCAARRFSAARRSALLCSPPARPVVQPAGPPCCAVRSVVQPAGPPYAARFLVQPSGALCCAVRLLVQPSVALCRAARPLVQPVGSLSCAGRPNVQLAGPSVLARPLVQPAENSCFSIGNTALQPARPAGPPFSVILGWVAWMSCSQPDAWCHQMKLKSEGCEQVTVLLAVYNHH